ncbi:MAG UNVERIFIED_CONTAM: hypothetical protein LVR18_30415 [Planctomycetaceae bacterium]
MGKLPSKCTLGLATLLLLAATQPATAQQRQVTAEQLLKQYVPIQKGVEFDTPKPEDFPKCRLVQEKNSYVIYGPANEPLRRFTDSNGDGPPDIYHYYRLGLEVYREIDTNGDHKARRNIRPDQFRWMNWGGTRWGVDANEDGRIESWKMISAQEAARSPSKPLSPVTSPLSNPSSSPTATFRPSRSPQLWPNSCRKPPQTSRKKPRPPSQVVGSSIPKASGSASMPPSPDLYPPNKAAQDWTSWSSKMPWPMCRTARNLNSSPSGKWCRWDQPGSL